MSLPVLQQYSNGQIIIQQARHSSGFHSPFCYCYWNWNNPYTSFITELVPSNYFQVDDEWVQTDIEDVQQLVYYYPQEDSINTTPVYGEEFSLDTFWTADNVEQVNSHQQLLNDEVESVEINSRPNRANWSRRDRRRLLSYVKKQEKYVNLLAKNRSPIIKEKLWIGASNYLGNKTPLQCSTKWKNLKRKCKIQRRVNNDKPTVEEVINALAH